MDQAKQIKQECNNRIQQAVNQKLKECPIIQQIEQKHTKDLPNIQIFEQYSNSQSTSDNINIQQLPGMDCPKITTQDEINAKILLTLMDINKQLEKLNNSNKPHFIDGTVCKTIIDRGNV